MRTPLFALLCAFGLPFLALAQDEPAAEAAEPQDFDRLTYHAPPKPLSPDAVTADWPRFLGPNDDGTSPETMLADDVPIQGYPVVWEVVRGGGYTCPAIVGDRLVSFHNIDDVDIVECLHPETGKRYWEFTYDSPFRDRYGFSAGPRASPVIAGNRVYTLSSMSLLHCLDLETGEVIWQRDLQADYEIGDFFFGHGPSPLVYKDQVIVPVGGAKGVAVAAFNVESGEVIWEAPHAEWRSSYASPVVGTFHGEDRILAFMGGESRPPVGGLMLINPKDGSVDSTFPWRAQKVESVNAATPIVIPENRVLISETYTEGAALLEVDENFEFQHLWTAEEFKLHWTTPLYKDGHFYAFTGRNEPDAALDCWEASSGELVWRENYTWWDEIEDRRLTWGFFRGSTFVADDKIYALGELGTLAILDLKPDFRDIVDWGDLFHARESWTLPAVSKGLLYVSQNHTDMKTGAKTRLICYDFRRGKEEAAEAEPEEKKDE